jgi:hypothetical protein
MEDRETGFSAQEAVAVQRALRRALGMEAETFPLEAFIGMISDEVEQFRASGKTDADIAALIRETIGRDVSEGDIGVFYAPPEARGRA